MVFYTYTLVMRPRNRHTTSLVIKEFAHIVFGAGGVIRKLTNEGMFRPYKRFRDEKGELHEYCRYWTLQADLSDRTHAELCKKLQDHPDVLKHISVSTENAQHLWRYDGRFVLDTFVRYEEEINWPPQVSAQAFDHMDMSWKEFSRNRWSGFLRS